HARQTAGDVARLGAFGRDTRYDVARLHVATRIDRDNGIDRELITSLTAAGELEDLVARLDDDGRTQILLVARGARTPVNDDALGDAGRLVKLFRHGQPVDQILELHIAFDLGQDRPRVGIPLGDALTAFDLLAVLDAEPRTIWDAVVRTLGAVW